MTNRLLVIDDQPDLCEFISEAAASMGFETCAVTDPDDFKSAVQEFQPTVVVLDLQMPGADGIELLRYLGERGSKAQVLVASGMDQRVLATAQQLGRAQGLNMLGALQKPIMLSDLEATLRQCLRTDTPISVAALTAALDRRELTVHYQPKATRVAPGHWIVEGVEALARWEHPSLGFVSPVRFIALAEKHSLIRRLTEQVLEMSLAQCREWDAAGLHLSVAVNLSPQLLNDLSFPDQVARMAAQVGADARRIIFEVTESAAMFDPGTTMDVLTRMRVKNFGLSIDDFGTGYSSLKQLYLMPFSELKIDTSFVRDIFAHEDARTMVETMILLAHKLRLTACAEGVESQEILDFLDTAACDRAQGYFIGRPMPGAALETAVREWNSKQK
ncbi:MAG TPA: EAL domain-containing response regulator [Steroidobacteraceae bacterium]|jgi:EAL domain-containing protein (putative c-di-GMP-specific phosphodiesterase class I)